GTDDMVCGETIMAELAKAMGGHGVIAILAGNQSAPNLQTRVVGVRTELKKYPGIKELNNGNGVFYHPETPEDAARTMQSAQTTNPQITGWALVGGWPLFTKGAIKTPPGQVKIVSVDALPPQLWYVENGYVDALYAQDCYGWGYKSVQFLMDKIVDGKNPPKTRMIDPLTKVTKENAKTFAKNWDKWLGGK
ncbi:MAG TPA: substrate-binding domain-containing protein, partial [Tepidisphaeraceae bacterium]|nr:substrate-binding domain-containing protein [Tepidisphaeraceae bacterium]